MSTVDRAKPAEHSLPHAGAPVAAHGRPFVGNESVADNLLECAQVAVWNALGPASSKVSLSIVGNSIRAGGHVDTREDRDVALRAIAASIAPAHVVDDLVVKGHSDQQSVAPGAPIVRVRRFCSLTDASLSAAIRSAMDRLDASFAANGVPAPERLAIVYRNRGESTVTVDVGAFIDPLTVTGASEVQNDSMPGGPDVSVLAQAGVKGLMDAQSLLLGETHGTEHDAIWWQIFSADEVRSWAGLPPAPLHLALQSVPHGEAPLRSSMFAG